MINPLEWFSFIYGKWFNGSPILGGFVVGGAMCSILAVVFGIVWVKSVDKFREDHPEKQGLVVAKTSLVLQFAGQNTNPKQVDEKNVFSWNTFAYYIKTPKDQLVGKVWMLFVVFDKPIDVKEIVIDGNGRQLPIYQVKNRNVRSAEIFFDGDILDTVVSIDFKN